MARYAVPESEAFDVIINEHLELLHAGRDKVWAAVQHKYYGIARQDVTFILKLCKNCALNRPATTKAPLVPIITERAWERVQIDLIDMRHEPSGQFKWILHIKDHFSKYTQLYPLKSKHAEPIAEAFALFIAAFLPPKIVQADNGKEFKGALLILLRKYGIQVINGAPRSPQTQGLVEQANGVVEQKIRAWKADHGSDQWVDGLLEVTLAINTQKHSTIGCAPVELLFRERTSYVNWLNSQKRKDMTIGITQEDPTQTPIYALNSSPPAPASSRIDIGIRQGNSQITTRISPDASSEINLRTTPPIRSSPIDEWFDIDAFEPEPEPESELERGHNSQLQARAPSRVGAPTRAQLRAAPGVGIELRRSGLNSDPKLELRRGSRPRVPARPITELLPTPELQAPRRDPARQRDYPLSITRRRAENRPPNLPKHQTSQPQYARGCRAPFHVRPRWKIDLDDPFSCPTKVYGFGGD